MKYDSKKNITEITQSDNITISYIWGYNNQHIIAEIKNTTHTSILAALGCTNEDQYIALCSQTNPDVAQIRTKLENYYAGTNTLINTFTYNPLIGITSQTNPMGVTTRYVFDNNSRLALVRDNNMNILSYNRYAFRNTPEIGIGSFLTPTAALQGSGAILVNTSNNVSISVSNGSGNFEYNWYLKNSSGTTISSLLNSSSTTFSYICAQSGVFTIQCIVKDVTTGTTYSFTKSINSYEPLSASFSSYSTSFNSYTLTGTSVISTINLTANYTGGSGNYLCNWEVFKNGTRVLYSTSSNTFSYLFQTAGQYILKCTFIDNVLGTSIVLTTSTIYVR